MINFTILFLCSGLFFSAFSLSFVIVSLAIHKTNDIHFEDNNNEDKFKYFYMKNALDYSEVVDASNNDYIDGIYEEETPVGLVIMTYNEEEKTFNYYCDRFIPNKMLEVVCRGFVLKYECYNILVDYSEEILKRYEVLNKVKEKEELLKKEKKDKEDDNLFAQMKSYNKKKSENSITNNDILIKTQFNKFKNCGKIEHYKKIENNINGDNNIQTYKEISFSDFKNKVHTK